MTTYLDFMCTSFELAPFFDFVCEFPTEFADSEALCTVPADSAALCTVPADSALCTELEGITGFDFDCDFGIGFVFYSTSVESKQ